MTQPNQYEDKEIADIEVVHPIDGLMTLGQMLSTDELDTIQQLITQKQLEARIDEVANIPNPLITFSDGTKINPNAKYRADRIAELTKQEKQK